MMTISEKEFKEFSGYIKANYGINLREEKRLLLSSRLQRFMDRKGFGSFSDYFTYVLKDNDALLSLVDMITTNHTFFMREEKHFSYMKETVLPYLYNTVKDKDLRIWSAGCSTGEEPYTLAMLLDDYFGNKKAFWNTKILATDISTSALEKAIAGTYTIEEINSIPSIWRSKYLVKTDDDSFMVQKKIKDEIYFRRFNLMKPDFPFRRKFHTIFCRNVMIYFDNKTKTDLINRFYDYTEDGGYLFIGHSETIHRDSTKYKYIMPAVYRKI